MPPIMVRWNVILKRAFIIVLDVIIKRQLVKGSQKNIRICRMNCDCTLINNLVCNETKYNLKHISSNDK